jgi:hypothetical protein
MSGGSVGGVKLLSSVTGTPNSSKKFSNHAGITVTNNLPMLFAVFLYV